MFIFLVFLYTNTKSIQIEGIFKEDAIEVNSDLDYHLISKKIDGNHKQTLKTIKYQGDVTFIRPFSGIEKVYILTRHVTEIADKLFYKNIDIQEVILHSKITKIGRSAFQASSIKKITLEQIEEIEPYAFHSCYNLDTIVLENIKFIGNHVFDDSGLKNIKINGKLSILPSNLFTKCYNLRYFTSDIPSLTIPAQTFMNLKSFEHFDFKGDQLNVHEQAFANSGLSTFNFSKLSEARTSSFSNTKLRSIDLLTVNNNGLVIEGENTFSNNNYLITIKISNQNIKFENVKDTFKNCFNLEYIEYYPEKIYDSMFKNCNKIKKIKTKTKIITKQGHFIPDYAINDLLSGKYSSKIYQTEDFISKTQPVPKKDALTDKKLNNNNQQQKPDDLSQLNSNKFKIVLILLNIIGLSIIFVVLVVICCDCKPKKKRSKSDSDSSDSIPDERTAKFAISSSSNNVDALHTCDSPLVKSSVVSNATDDNVSYEVAMDSNLPEPTKMLSVDDINE